MAGDRTVQAPVSRIRRDAKLRDAPGFPFELRWLLAAAIIGSGVVAVSARAEPPTPEQTEGMLHENWRRVPQQPSDYKLPYYRWHDGAPISVFIVTSAQTGPCVEAARSSIQKEINSIRSDIKALRNIHDAIVATEVPKDRNESAILIGLPTENAKIADSMATYVHANRPKAEFVDLDMSYVRGAGYLGSNDRADAEPIFEFDNQLTVAVQDQEIVQGYRWSVHLRGLGIYSAQECKDFEWSVKVVDLLGGQNFVPFYGKGWLSAATPSKRREWEALARKLFLRALYSCSGPIPARECVASSLNELWRHQSGFPN
jgi:hypothetical protein